MYELLFYNFIGPTTNDLQLDDSSLPLTAVIDRDFDKCSIKNSISAGLQSSGITIMKYILKLLISEIF